MAVLGIEIPEFAGYAGLFLLIFLGEAGVPLFVPAEVALIAAGIAAAHGTASLSLAIALALIADLLGALTLYLVVRLARDREWTGWRGRLQRLAIRRAHWLGAHDVWRVVAGRSIPYLRIPASGAAALAGLRGHRFVAAALAGGVIWISLFLVGAYAVTRIAA